MDDPIPLPQLNGVWSGYVCPLLEVTQSGWLKTFSPSRLAPYEHVRHYRVISMDNTVGGVRHATAR